MWDKYGWYFLSAFAIWIVNKIFFQKKIRPKTTVKEHQRLVGAIQCKFQNETGKVSRISKDGNNKLRHNDANSRKVDTRKLRNIIEVDYDRMVCWVQSGCTFADLCEFLIPLGAMPKVVPEFPDISIGGAIMGLGIESTSFKHGLFHCTCLEYEILLGNGEILWCSNSQNSSLFHGVPNSLGSLGILLSARIELQKCEPYVTVLTESFSNFEDFATKMSSPTSDIDFVEAMEYHDLKEIAFVTGKMQPRDISLPIYTFTRFGDVWFWRKIRHLLIDNSSSHIFQTPLSDYFFRHDRGSFWMIEESRNSSWNYLDCFQTAKIGFQFLSSYRSPEVVQALMYIEDIGIPTDRLVEFRQHDSAFWVLDNITSTPSQNQNITWYCPFLTTGKESLVKDSFAKNGGVNIGLYRSMTSNKTWLTIKNVHRAFHRIVEEVTGQIFLYGYCYENEDEFWKGISQGHYKKLRHKYKAEDSFPDLYLKYSAGRNKMVPDDVILGLDDDDWDCFSIWGWIKFIAMAQFPFLMSILRVKFYHSRLNGLE